MEKRSLANVMRMVVLAVAGLLAAGTVQAASAPRWAPLGPPAGPLSAHLFPDPGNGARQYALTVAGLWRTQNGGGSWSAIQQGLGAAPQALALDPAHPGRLYAAVQGLDDSASILRSEDFGDHWRAVYHTPQGETLGTLDFQVDPFAPSTLYWLRNQLLYRSDDEGKTWSCVAVRDGCTVVTSFAFAPDRPDTLYLMGGFFFYRTADGGRTWSQSTVLENGFPADTVVATRAPRTLYASLRDPVYRDASTPCFARSDDEGTTWKAVLPNTRCGTPGIDPEDPRTVRIVVDTGLGPQLWRSRDGGDHWAAAGGVPYVGDLSVGADGRLWLSSDHGVFQAADEQGPWRPSNRGFAASEITALLTTEHGVLAAPARQLYTSTPVDIPLVRTVDEGHTWTGVALANVIALGADPGDPRHLLASALRFEPPYSYVYRVLESRDEGLTWRGVLAPQADHPPVFLQLAADPDARTLYAGTEYGGFYRSTDAGRTWAVSNAGLQLAGCSYHYCPSNWVHAILTDPKTSGRLLILFEKQVYESLDSGASWTPRGPQLPRDGRVMALTREPGGALVAATTGTRPSDTGRLGAVYRSADGGLTWTRSGTLPRLPATGRATELTGLAATPSGLFAGTNFLGVLWSRDGGNLWTPLNDGLPSPAVSSLIADPFVAGRLLATVPGNGVYTIAVP
ncbi:MAG TPA: hypothetical protein VGH73_06090 [Thermoanaerobaculia bacterium]|jgi:hypothetical protein